MAAVAKLQAMLGMDSKEFKAGMKGATKDANDFQSQIKKVGSVIAASFSVGAIIGMGKSLATWAGNVSEAAQNAGILTSEMMALNEIALQGGLGVDEMRRMISKLQAELYSAAQGTETSRKKFEDLGLNVTELAGMDPAAMFEKVTKAAFDSGVPLQHLAELFGDKLGPKAVSALRELADNGLPAVGQAAADAADRVEELGDRWDATMEKMRRKALEVFAATADGMEVAASYVKGAAGSMSTTEKLVRLGLAVPTAGLSLILGKTARDAGMGAAIETQNTQMAEGQASADKKRKQQQDAADALQKTASETETRLAFERRKKEGEAQTRASEAVKRQTEAEEAQRQKGYAKNRALAKETSSFEERKARLNEQLFGLTSGSGTASQMSPDAYARVGGFMGGEREGLDVAGRSLQVQTESQKILGEIKELTRQHLEAVQTIKGGTI